MAFRVTELHMLLGFAQESKCGRKTDLQERALALLAKPRTDVISKIKELHDKVSV